MRALYEEDFLKQVTILSEREKKISLDITGDFFTVQEMRDNKVPESLSRYLEQASLYRTCVCISQHTLFISPYLRERIQEVVAFGDAHPESFKRATKLHIKSTSP